MKEMRLQYSVPLMCRIYNVSASGYYAHVTRPLSKRGQEDARLEVEIKAAHKRTRQVCGAERLQKDLADNGIAVGVCRIKRLRKKLGIRCKQKKKFKTTTNSKHTLPVAENLLDQQFEVSRAEHGMVERYHYMFGPMKDGCTLPRTRIFLTVRLWDMPWENV